MRYLLSIMMVLVTIPTTADAQLLLRRSINCEDGTCTVQRTRVRTYTYSPQVVESTGSTGGVALFDGSRRQARQDRRYTRRTVRQTARVAAVQARTQSYGSAGGAAAPIEQDAAQEQQGSQAETQAGASAPPLSQGYTCAACGPLCKCENCQCEKVLYATAPEIETSRMIASAPPVQTLVASAPPLVFSDQVLIASR